MNAPTYFALFMITHSGFIIGSVFVCLFVCLICFFTSHQQPFSYKGTGLPGLNQYKARINVLAQGHNTVTPVRFEPAALRSRVNHSTTEPLCSLSLDLGECLVQMTNYLCAKE